MGLAGDQSKAASSAVVKRDERDDDGNPMTLIRPEPAPQPDELEVVTRRTDPAWAASALLNGQALLVSDLFSTGLGILSRLRGMVRAGLPENRPGQGAEYETERAFRSQFRRASNLLLAPIENHQLLLRKAPQVDWFPLLYPEIGAFLLPFPQVQGLNSSWQWYERGIEIPTLRRRLHPYYGTYFPTRFEHLELFARWLDTFSGSKQTAIDVGTGCGVLAFQLCDAGFDRVIATDINPNAIESVALDCQRLKATPGIALHHSDLLQAVSEPADLIVFNPPWLPGEIHSEIDRAIYYDDSLFERFFAQASARLKPQGRLVLLFSNLITRTDKGGRHPIEHEIQAGCRFQRVCKLQERVQAASKKTKRRRRDPKQERVELWELAPLS